MRILNIQLIGIIPISVLLVSTTHSFATVPAEVLQAVNAVEQSVTSITIIGTTRNVNHRIGKDAEAEAFSASSETVVVRVENQVIASEETLSGNGHRYTLASYINASDSDPVTSSFLCRKDAAIDMRLAACELRNEVGQVIYYLDRAPGENSSKFLEPTPAKVIINAHHGNYTLGSAFASEWSDATWQSEDVGATTRFSASVDTPSGNSVIIATFDISKTTGRLESFKEYALRGDSEVALLHQRTISYGTFGPCPAKAVDVYYDGSNPAPYRTLTAEVKSVRQSSAQELRPDAMLFLTGKNPTHVIEYSSEVPALVPLAGITLK